MPVPRKYPQELQERAVRLVLEGAEARKHTSLTPPSLVLRPEN
jgi:hypothetical protein